MKKIEAVIRPNKLEAVRIALQEIGICEMMISEVKGHGLKEGYEMIYRGTRQFIDIITNLKIEIVIKDEVFEDCIATLSQAARTGQVGDGKIFVTDIERAIRIRTGDEDERAV